ncbi:hypothetical protein [Nocardia mangyaensis]|uniref:hypothetical protein n=1 Tax=Nocardia mangyaensis TaxID=2213200 RepID=UPI0012EC545D|nr:hypothetical protein [Nocardia mangyaensis]
MTLTTTISLLRSVAARIAAVIAREAPPSVGAVTTSIGPTAEAPLFKGRTTATGE